MEAYPRAARLPGSSFSRSIWPEGVPVQGCSPVSPSSLEGAGDSSSCLSEVPMPQLLILCLPVTLPLYEACGSSSQAVLGHLSRMCLGLPLPRSHPRPCSPTVFPFQRSLCCQT